ncbi:hypothetical protein F5Y18DRAFT_25414 [Xylariaceae sp. FL1019]|nr:hypothetical protein F5Y18DRAFT_25414 [Xylariaceae sp. FL1019]
MVAPNSPPQNVASDSHAAELPRIELWSATDSEVDSDRIWDEQLPPAMDHSPNSSAEGHATPTVPDPLRPGAGPSNSDHGQDEHNPWDDAGKGGDVSTMREAQVKRDEVPKALVPGPSRSETNPFKRKPVQSTSPITPPQPRSQPASQSPTEPFSMLRLDDPSDQSKNPWQPALDMNRGDGQSQPPPIMSHQDSGSDVWGSAPVQKPYIVSNPTTPAHISPHPTGDFTPWDDVPPPVPSHPILTKSAEVGDLLGDEHAWDEIETRNKGKQVAVPQSQSPLIDDWNVIDPESVTEPEPAPLSRQSTWENFVDADDGRAKENVKPEPVTDLISGSQPKPPALPPRNTTKEAPPQPSRPNTTIGLETGAPSESVTYDIKIISWFDSQTDKNPRELPILMQNLNGPCPLLALVNALTLTTPPEQTDSILVQALRSKKNKADADRQKADSSEVKQGDIDLDYLLQAVIQELTARRPELLEDPTKFYDDIVPELSAFLKGLQTGMNVNPRFVPSAEAIASHKRTSPSHVHPPDRDAGVPGTFENTRDMKQYAMFGIPLIHGWLPPTNDPVYDALGRHATSYDDAQNLLFREEELEVKFSTSETGLTQDEQQLYQDIISIKSFLSFTATQLTPFGLEVIAKAMKPGEVSILFRNDHFSTLYRHPQTLQLFTLITDWSYKDRVEFVWESLVDVTGGQTEHFSGDFRIVSGGNERNARHDNAEASNSNENAWQTVQNPRSRINRQNDPAADDLPVSPHEQEDRDLALALQLQEEEDERHRNEQAARRRESQLSEQFLEQQGRDGGSQTGRDRPSSISNSARASSSTSLPPPRGSSIRRGAPAQTQQVRSLIPPRTRRPADDEAEDAPPSYEQAAKTTPYVPPAGHPSHPESSPRNSARRSTGALQGEPATAGPSTPRRDRQSGSASAATATATAGGHNNPSARERECAMM